MRWSLVLVARPERHVAHVRSTTDTGQAQKLGNPTSTLLYPANPFCLFAKSFPSRRQLCQLHLLFSAGKCRPGAIEWEIAHTG
jgi:hypothetical protein